MSGDAGFASAERDLVARMRQIRWLACVLLVLSLLIVAVSAYLRLDAAGLGCADWPACYARVLAGEPQPLHYGFARLLHRVAASSALLLALLLLWRCWRPCPVQPAARHALLLVLLMLVLSVLGFFSADPRRALIGFLNLIGGLGLVSFSWRVAMAATSRPDSGALPPFARLAALLLTLTVVAGAWIGASYAAAACSTLPFCALGDGDAGMMRAFNPLLQPQAPPPLGDAGAALLHNVHRGLALGALVFFIVCAWRSRRCSAWIVCALLLLTLVTGAATIGSGMRLWLVVGHGVAAALLLAAVATLLKGQWGKKEG